MENRLESFGGSGSTLVFAHANGYPPGSYRRFLEPLADHHTVLGYRHRPLWNPEPAPAPLRADWHQFARDLLETLDQQVDGPVWMMGHSLGAVVSMLAALREPTRFRGLVLLDPVFLPARHILTMRLAPGRSLQRMPLIRKTLGRPARFSDASQAFEFHRGKRAFSGLDDAVLWDYIHAGTRPTGPDSDAVELAWTPGWEAAVYTSAPLVWPRLARLRLPTLGLRGARSDILTEAAMKRWARRQPNAELHTLPGGHLLPLEHPGETARHVIDFLRRQEGACSTASG